MSGPERGDGGPVDPGASKGGAWRNEQGLSALEAVHEPQRRADQQRPASRPEDFRLRGESPRVIRLSRKALAVVGAVACISIGGALIYALQPNRNLAPQNLFDTTHTTKSDVVTSAPGTYDKVPKLGPPLPGDLGRPILAAQSAGQSVPVPGMGSQATGLNDPRFIASQQARERIQQERASAMGSQLFMAAGGAEQAGVGSPAGTGGGAATSMANNGADGAAGTNSSQVKETSSQGAKRAFLQVSGTRTTVSAERIAQAPSPNVLQAGSIIPAALITGIRSDLPGQITAQVTQNVYDSSTGRILLIPQGSRLIGDYDSQVTAGQTRVLLAWDRLILPGGRSILLDRQPGTDASGFAGLQDKVNYHWGNMLRAAAISTLLGFGTELATNSTDQLVQALRYGADDTINQTGKQLIQRALGVAPTLTIRLGYPLRVIITRDLVLEPQGGEP